MRERSAERECCLLVLNLASSTPPYPPAGAACRVLGDSLGVCGRVYVCTQAFIGFLAFELLVNNASSDTLAFSLRLVPFLPAADSPATHAGSSASPSKQVTSPACTVRAVGVGGG